MQSGCHTFSLRVKSGAVKTVQIRDVPDDVHAELRARAAAAGLSLSQYLLGEVTRIAERPPIAEILKRATKRTWGVPAGRAVEALRQVRDEEAR
jgi:antitoxin FitA